MFVRMYESERLAIQAGFKLSVLLLAISSASLAYAADSGVNETSKTATKKSAAETASLSDINEVEFLEVVGQAAQVEKALKEQRVSDSIESVVHADAIGQMPDDNAAEALQRLPGVSIERDQGEGRFVTIRGLAPDLNSVNINGVNIPSPESGRRAVALDVLPSELIQSLSVVKTLTPDMDANSLGGTINVKSLSGFDHKGFFYTTSAEAAYNPLVSETSPKISGALSNIFSIGEGTNNLAVALALSFQQRKFGSENVETGGAWDFSNTDAPRLGKLEERDYKIQRDRLGFGLNFDYKPDDLSSYYLRTIYSRFKDIEQRNLSGLKFENDQLPGEFGDAEGYRELKDRTETQEIKSITFGGEKNIGLWTINAQGAYSEASEKNPLGIANAAFKSDLSNAGYSSTKTPYIITSSGNFNSSAFELDEIEEEKSITIDKLKSANMDFTRLYAVGDYDAQVKFGTKFSRRAKTNDLTSFVYDDFGTSSTSLSDYLSGNSISSSAIKNLISQLDRNAAYDELESTVNDFKMKEDINSAYVMNTIDIDRLRLIAGIRYEGTRFAAKGTKFVEGSGSSSDTYSQVSTNNHYQNFLPGLHAKYKLDGSTQLRAAYTHSVVRPTFEQLAPGTKIADDEASFGNPYLKPLKAKNIDVGIEHYMSNTGVISAFAFYKNITDFAYQTDVKGTGEFVDFDEALTFVNGDSAKVYGLELAYSQKLDWLSYPWNKLILGANATVSDSTAEIGSSGKTRQIRLPNQSKEVGNLSIGWQDSKFSVRLSGNYKSSYLREVGAVDAKENDLYTDAQLYVDLSASYFITPKMQLTFDAQNITDEKYYTYQNSRGFNAQYESYGPTYRVSMTLTDF